MASTDQSAPYRISTQEAEASFRTLQHPLDPSIGRCTFSLGDHCGLSRVGVHLCRAAARTTTVLLHYHHNEEEFFYILDAGASGATLLTYKEGDEQPREEAVKTGDFIGFPAGRGVGYALRAGDEELSYLCGGTRAPMDICRYPTVGKSMVVDRTGAVDGGHFLVEDKDTQKWGK
ncbi:hypothetical protein PHLGIDRAFT_364456 [Phlebiopsis gigantea 11061_1 CR5-6]|uniref:Uncharacterized protein n=1 Tax=Phlebiopsis gigantea (strain 11061_1 CR5-6) TaxID=745531 RepID=A0A0C3RPE3_PHLG1|nr:hypothetical protein PHLGIDRAFT_364456 [Phlebiopsis gigantea 11061_1 CR5-6]